MKRETIVLILFALAVMAGAASATISVPANYGNGKHLGIFFTDASGSASVVTPSNKLPVDALVTIGSISAVVTGTVVATIPEAISVGNFPTDQTVSGNVGISGVASVTQAPPTSFVQHDLIASPTAGSFTTSAGCESLMLRTIDKEMWFSLDGIGATVSSGIPLCASSTGYAQQAFSCGPNVTVYFVASVSTKFKAVETIR